MTHHLLSPPHKISCSALFAAPLLLAVSLLAGCAAPPIHHVHAAADPRELAIQSFRQQWALDPDVEEKHGGITKLYARDTYVFAYTKDGTSYVFDRANGHLLHAETVRNGDQRLHPPVVLKDFIVYPTTTALEVYDRAGNLVRSKNLNYPIRSDAVGSRNYVYLGADFSTGGRVVAIDVTSEYLVSRWQLMYYQTNVTAAPALVGDIVYSAAGNGDVSAVTYDNREPVWPILTFHTFGPVIANLVADETGVYVASADTKLVALNRNNGLVKWQYFAGTELRSDPVVTKDLVFLSVPGKGLVVLDKVGGKYNRTPRWEAADATEFLAEDDKYVYVRREDNAIVALDKANGQAVFASKRRDFATFAPNPRDGTVYAATKGGEVMAIIPVLKSGQVGEVVFAPVGEWEAVAAAR
ncbi:MAG: Pyrrolo-quinoline quinone repeat-containing protein [Phycisphaerales bacterium]|nr:Pyrrolo-quinoline quinone repeat-containing protein [Phycisphaerales bacterium]